ncbi:MAG: ATP-binding protein [Alphaproteobacteria bacterium]
MRRWWPAGLGGRIAVIVTLALLVWLILGVLHYLFGDRVDRPPHFATAARIVAAVALLERGAPPDEVLPAVNSPSLELVLTDDAPLPGAAWGGADATRARIARALTPLANRALRIEFAERQWAWTWRDDDPLLPRWGGMTVAVARAEGGWYAFTVRAPQRPPRPWRGAFFVVLTAAAVLVLALWATHRVTRPLRSFAAAADRFGVDVGAPPLPETGSSEVRTAARAFNRMQDRLKRFVDDRTLMLGAISHDLRTVLTRLRLRAEFIADDEQRGKALADMAEMQTMLDESLAFARDDAAAEPRQRLDIAALLQTACDDAPAATYDGPDRAPFQGRPVALRRAFDNLIGNACLYGAAAEVRLREEDDRCVIAIADRGPGIPVDLREAVFRPFTRLETSRNRETGGAGLGLAVARGAVHAHGGEIELADRPGGGLVITVILPRP